MAPGERDARDHDQREAAEREAGGAASGGPRGEEAAVDDPRDEREQLALAEAAAVALLSHDADREPEREQRQ